MKITKKQLRDLIKEEVAANSKAIDGVRQVVELWDSIHNSLRDDESKKMFEDYLGQNFEAYTKKWRDDRDDREDPDDTSASIEEY
jgi:hypothetical protein